jgi:1-acyl-sn-glycerol-3-phosphate acyltransferase
MRSLLNAAFTAPWTAAVTFFYISWARASGNVQHAERGERLWAKGLLGAWGVDLDVSGREHFEGPGPWLIMANHQSHVDIPVLFAALPVTPGFVAKQELDKIPFLSMALRGGEHVLIDRSNRDGARRSIGIVSERVQGGRTVAIFPEGTRGDGQRLAPFKRGAFLIAKSAKVPLVPVGIQGTHAVLRRDSWLPEPGRVVVRIGAPILPEDIQQRSALGLTRLAEQRISELSGLLPPQATGTEQHRATDDAAGSRV